LIDLKKLYGYLFQSLVQNLFDFSTEYMKLNNLIQEQNLHLLF